MRRRHRPTRSDVACERVLIGRDRVAPPDPELGPRWFVGARLNFAENLLRYRDDREALVFWNERGAQRRLTYRRTVRRGRARRRRAARAWAFGAGDRVAGFMPNIPETVIAMLATTSLGAIWSSCSPDFGVNGVLDRFGQIQPRVLFCADGYRYAGQRDRLPRARARDRRADSGDRARRRRSVSARASRDVSRDSRRACRGTSFASTRPPSAHARVRASPVRSPALHHVLVGHDGAAEVHGARRRRNAAPASEGARAAHRPHARRPHLLLHDVRLDDVELARVERSPSARRSCCTTARRSSADRPILWDMAADERITVFGTSAKWLALAEKDGLRAGRDARPRRAATRFSRPAVRSPTHSFDYVYEKVKRDVRLSSISGGTDIISCFALGNPIGPVWRGELQARGLGMKVEVFDEDGQSGRRRAGRARVHGAVPEHAGRVLERSRRREVPRGVLRSLSRTSGDTATGRSSRRTAA